MAGAGVPRDLANRATGLLKVMESQQGVSGKDVTKSAPCAIGSSAARKPGIRDGARQSKPSVCLSCVFCHV